MKFFIIELFLLIKIDHIFPLANLPDAPECDVNDPMSCDKRKHEVGYIFANQFKFLF